MNQILRYVFLIFFQGFFFFFFFLMNEMIFFFLLTYHFILHLYRVLWAYYHTFKAWTDVVKIDYKYGNSTVIEMLLDLEIERGK
jgi:hypothetical protein